MVVDVRQFVRRYQEAFMIQVSVGCIDDDSAETLQRYIRNCIPYRETLRVFTKVAHVLVRCFINNMVLFPI